MTVVVAAPVAAVVAVDGAEIVAVDGAEIAAIASVVDGGRAPHSHYLADCCVPLLGLSWLVFLPFLFPLKEPWLFS